MRDCRQQKLLKICSWKMMDSHKRIVLLSGVNPPHGKIPIGVARELCVKHLFDAKDVNHFAAQPSKYEFLLYRGGLTLEDFYRITDEFMEDVVCTLSPDPYYCSINPFIAQIYMASAALVWRIPIPCSGSVKELSESAWTAFGDDFKHQLLPAVTRGLA